jgi:hypothetical protein
MAARMGTLTVIAFLAGFGGAWLTFAIGDLPGSLIAAGLLGTLTILSVGAAATALQALLGPGATIVTILVFVVLGYPASGGPVATQLLPGFCARSDSSFPSARAPQRCETSSTSPTPP